MSSIAPSKNLSSIWEQVSHDGLQLLYAQYIEFQKTKPLLGVSLLQGIPCSIEAACKASCLKAAGADVAVRKMQGIHPASEKLATALLQQVGIQVLEENHIPTSSFDLYLDCSAEMLSFPAPKIGTVEITQTGSCLYNQASLSHPVLSVDQSPIKVLEDFMGTGAGFCEAFEKLSAKPIEQFTFLVIGYGRVGAGVVHHLQKKGASVAVLEVSEQAIAKAKQVTTDVANYHDSVQREALIRKADVLVTATGVKGLLSKEYSSEQLKGKILANVGAEDEIGENFSPQDALCDKFPINFSLDAPTPTEYLDPILVAHNLAAIHLVKQKVEPGSHPLPREISQQVWENWNNTYPVQSSQLPSTLYQELIEELGLLSVS